MSRAADAIRAWVPRWWSGEAGYTGTAASAVLAPAELGFRGVVAARNLAYERGWLPTVRARIPVASIGNLGVGGAGKTPFAAWVAARLRERGHLPAIVLRGYGDDELAVHRELNPDVPVFAAADRASGVEAAARAGCGIAVLDDAFQHRNVARDLDVVLVAAESWAGNRRLLPRGPWRETAAALGRADLVVITRKSASREAAAAAAEAVRRMEIPAPVAICHLRPTELIDAGGAVIPLDWLKGRRILVVASLADPGALQAQIRQLGADAELLAFPDHHPFDSGDVRRIAEAAAGRNVVCTRKEMVKLRPLIPPDLKLVMLTQGLAFDSGAGAVEHALASLPNS